MQMLKHDARRAWPCASNAAAADLDVRLLRSARGRLKERREDGDQNHSGTISGASPIDWRISCCTYSGSIENSLRVS